MQEFKILIIGFFIVCLSATAIAANNTNKQLIYQRIKPVGQVNVTQPQTQPNKVTETTEQAKQTTPVKVTETTKKPQKEQQLAKNVGATVYKNYCAVCHTSGAAGAPKTGDEQAWKPRLAKGMNKLVENAIKGYKLMPPKGTCMTCTDAEIKAAVEFMVANDKSNATQNQKDKKI